MDKVLACLALVCCVCHLVFFCTSFDSNTETHEHMCTYVLLSCLLFFFCKQHCHNIASRANSTDEREEGRSVWVQREKRALTLCRHPISSVELSLRTSSFAFFGFSCSLISPRYHGGLWAAQAADCGKPRYLNASREASLLYFLQERMKVVIGENTELKREVETMRVRSLRTLPARARTKSCVLFCNSISCSAWLMHAHTHTIVAHCTPCTYTPPAVTAHSH